MNNLRALRELRGLKQLAVAKDLGVKSSVSISEWETGRKGLSVENAIMFSRYYCVSVGCVVGTEPIPEGYPDSYFQPISYNKLVAEHQKAAEEGRLYKPTKKPPFTQEQTAYLEAMEDRIVEKVSAALREDTLLLKETGSQGK